MKYRLVQAILVIAISAAIVGTATGQQQTGIAWGVTVSAVNQEDIEFSPDVDYTIGEVVGNTIEFKVTTGSGYNLPKVAWYFDNEEDKVDEDVSESTYSKTFDNTGTHTIKCEIRDGEGNIFIDRTWVVEVAEELNITDYYPKDTTIRVYVLDGETKTLTFNATSSIPCWHVWTIINVNDGVLYTQSNYEMDKSSNITYEFPPGAYNVTLELKKWNEMSEG